MRNPQFYVSGNRPIVPLDWRICAMLPCIPPSNFHCSSDWRICVILPFSILFPLFLRLVDLCYSAFLHLISLVRQIGGSVLFCLSPSYFHGSSDWRICVILHFSILFPLFVRLEDLCYSAFLHLISIVPQIGGSVLFCLSPSYFHCSSDWRICVILHFSILFPLFVRLEDLCYSAFLHLISIVPQIGGSVLFCLSPSYFHCSSDWRICVILHFSILFPLFVRLEDLCYSAFLHLISIVPQIGGSVLFCISPSYFHCSSDWRICVILHFSILFPLFVRLEDLCYSAFLHLISIVPQIGGSVLFCLSPSYFHCSSDWRICVILHFSIVFPLFFRLEDLCYAAQHSSINCQRIVAGIFLDLAFHPEVRSQMAALNTPGGLEIWIFETEKCFYWPTSHYLNSLRPSDTYMRQ